MLAIRGKKPQVEFLLRRILSFIVLLASFANAPGAFGQAQTGGPVEVASPPQGQPHSEAVSPLQDLLTEAEQNNPQIQAARQGWQAARQVPGG